MIMFALFFECWQNASVITIELPRATAIAYSKKSSEFLVLEENPYPEKHRLLSISDNGFLANRPLISDAWFEVNGFDPDGKVALTSYSSASGKAVDSVFKVFTGPDTTAGLVVRGNWMLFPSSDKLLIWNFSGRWELNYIITGFGYSDKYGIDPSSGRAVILNIFKASCQIVVQDPSTEAPVTISVPVVEGFYLVHPEKSVEFLDADTFVFAGGQPRAGEPTKNNRYLYVASISKRVIRPVAEIDARGAHNHPGWRNTIAIGKKHIAICVQSGVTLVPIKSAWQALGKSR